MSEELAVELDQLAGAEHKLRTAYVVDVLWRDVGRNRQREALTFSAGAWNPADHPELAQGGTAQFVTLAPSECVKSEEIR